jgi:hypothetical protein
MFLQSFAIPESHVQVVINSHLFEKLNLKIFNQILHIKIPIFKKFLHRDLIKVQLNKNLISMKNIFCISQSQFKRKLECKYIKKLSLLVDKHN